MRTVALMLTALGVAVATANAEIKTDPNQGALRMKLFIDATGGATLTNVFASALNVDSYEIWSSSNKCSPDNWKSIMDAVEENSGAVSAALGSGALAFGEFDPTTGILAEGNTAGHAVFQPGAPWAIGKPVWPAILSDISFYYTMDDGTYDKYLGLVELPEPATMAILTLGSLGILARRRHK